MIEAVLANIYNFKKVMIIMHEMKFMGKSYLIILIQLTLFNVCVKVDWVLLEALDTKSSEMDHHA